MKSILLSINPQYVKGILDGTKKYEFRRKLPREKIKKIIIYSTSPKMKIVGEVEVLDVISLNKIDLWDKTKSNAGICFDKYQEYFENCDIANAYELGKVKRYNPVRDLSDYSIKKAPQSFMYIK